MIVPPPLGSAREARYGLIYSRIRTALADCKKLARAPLLVFSLRSHLQNGRRSPICRGRTGSRGFTTPSLRALGSTM